MNDHLVVTLDNDLNIINVDKRKTDGLAHQLALRITDSGQRVRLIDPEEADDVWHLWEQIKEKRTMGFIGEYGHIPNGDRSHGEGARTVGRMIYEPLGIKLEGQNPAVARSGSTLERQPDMTAPLTLSSNENENLAQKTYEFPDKKFTITLG